MHHHYPILFNVMCSQVCQLVEDTLPPEHPRTSSTYLAPTRLRIIPLVIASADIRDRSGNIRQRIIYGKRPDPTFVIFRQVSVEANNPSLNNDTGGGKTQLRHRSRYKPSRESFLEFRRGLGSFFASSDSRGVIGIPEFVAELILGVEA